eukprot:4821758-Pyramimonas_sp.AAC.1
MADEDYVEAGYVHCMGAYWIPPQRVGWCRVCSALGDWKIMMAEYVDELSCGEMRRYAEASEYNPQCPELRKG